MRFGHRIYSSETDITFYKGAVHPLTLYTTPTFSTNCMIYLVKMAHAFLYLLASDRVEIYSTPPIFIIEHSKNTKFN